MTSRQIIIRELAPREGFQILPYVVPTEEKLNLIRALTKAGLPEIEVTSFVRADKVPQLADCEQVVRALASESTSNKKSGNDVRYRALCLNPKGFERACSFDHLINDAWFYTGASDTFLAKNANTTFQKQLDSIATEWLPLWSKRGLKSNVHVMISNAFGCAYEGEIHTSTIVNRWEQICAVFKKLDLSQVELSLADTVGHATPAKTHELLNALAPTTKVISLHLHDTRGAALACAQVGLELGVRVFESSVAGLGGCPFTAGAAGNIATEKLVELCESKGFNTGINRAALNDAAHVAHKLAKT